MSRKGSSINLTAIRAEEKTRAEGFRMIGAFIFWFSQLEFSLRDVLARVLKLKDSHFDVITSPYDFAIICKMTKEILIQHEPQATDRISELVKACYKLNDERTKIAHGMWTVNTGALVARHVSRNTLKPTVLYENPTELVALAEEAQRLITVLYNLFRNDDAAVKIIGVEHLLPKPRRKRASKAKT